MGVPILRIPVLALKVIFDQLDDLDLVIVSLLSRRANWFLRTCGKTNVSLFNLKDSELGLELLNIDTLQLLLIATERQTQIPEWNLNLRCIVPNFELQIRRSNYTVQIRVEALKDIEKFVGLKRNLKIGGSVVPVVMDKDEKLYTFWKSKTNGMIVLLDYFKNNFNSSIQDLMFSGKDTRAMKTVVNHLNSTHILVKNVQVAFKLTDTGFKFILENVSATENFFSQFVPSQEFKFDGAIRAKSIKIYCSNFYKINNLLISTEMEKIDVRGRGFDEEECRMFMRAWTSGKLPNLKQVNLTAKRCYPNLTEGFAKRLDKCAYGRAISGTGDNYATVSGSQMERGSFYMRVNGLW